MNEIKVAVVILNFNGKHFLEKFLPIVIQNSAPHLIVVADNGSSDGSVEYVQKHFKSIVIIENNGNYGYPKGYNLALKQIDAKYFILLNSDVEVKENWIEPIIQLMETDTQIAACQPKLLDYNHTSLYEYAGAAGGFIDAYGYPFCRGRVFNTLEKNTAQYDDAREVFWATGACLFVNAEAFWEVGGLDEDYFAHMEEIDLCWRLKNIGYKIYVEPKSIVYHVGGGTLHKLSSKKTFLNFRNNLITFTKNHPSKNLFIKILFRLILDGVAAFKFLFEGQPSHFYAVLKAHFSYYYWLPKTLVKRKALKKLKGFHFNNTQIYKSNIVIDYFIKGKKHFSDLSQNLFEK